MHPSSMARVLFYPSLDSLEAVECTFNQRWLWSDCANAQSDLSLRWSHKSYRRFSRALAQTVKTRGLHYTCNQVFCISMNIEFPYNDGIIYIWFFFFFYNIHRNKSRPRWHSRMRVRLVIFRGDWSWNIFYGHSPASADSRRTVVNFWRVSAQVLANHFED